MDEPVLTGSGRAQRVEDRHDALDVGLGTAHHQAIAFGQPPDTTRHTGVDESNSFVGQQVCVRLVLGVTRVAPVDHQIALLEHPGQTDDGLVGDRSGGHHHPDDPGRGQLLCQFLQRRDIGHFGPRVVSDDLVAAVAQARAHVEPHFSQANQTQLHVNAPFRVFAPVSREGEPASTGRHSRSVPPGTARLRWLRRRRRRPDATPPADSVW